MLLFDEIKKYAPALYPLPAFLLETVDIFFSPRPVKSGLQSFRCAPLSMAPELYTRFEYPYPKKSLLPGGYWLRDPSPSEDGGKYYQSSQHEFCFVVGWGFLLGTS